MILHHGSSLIRKSADIMLICSSPRLIAACHVLHRLLMPRHSLCALVRLNFCRYPFWISCSLSAWIAVYHVLYSYFFRLAKLFNFTQLWKDLIFHHIFSLCLLSLFVYLILFPIQFSMIVRRSEPAASSIFIGLLSYSRSLLNPLKVGWIPTHPAFVCSRKLFRWSSPSLACPGFRTGGLKWTRTTDLALIRRAL